MNSPIPTVDQLVNEKTLELVREGHSDLVKFLSDQIAADIDNEILEGLLRHAKDN